MGYDSFHFSVWFASYHLRTEPKRRIGFKFTMTHSKTQWLQLRIRKLAKMNTRNILQILFGAAISLTLVSQSCCDYQRAKSGPIGNAQKIQNASTPVVAQDICSILNEPERFDGKRISVRTWLIVNGNTFYVGDDDCIPRHPLIDVSISDALVNSLCSSNQNNERSICLTFTRAMNKQREQSSFVHFEIDATITGNIRLVEVSDGFSIAGKRIRLKVVDIDRIWKVQERDLADTTETN